MLTVEPFQRTEVGGYVPNNVIFNKGW